MKMTLRAILLAFSLLFLAGSAAAQSANGNHRSDKNRLTREQLAEVQAKHIAGELALDDDKAERFVSTFCNFQKELWALGPRINTAANRRPKRGGAADSEQAIKQRFERSRQILSLREKYYAEYSKFLTQQQIERAYEIERQMMNRLAKRKNGRQR